MAYRADQLITSRPLSLLAALVCTLLALWACALFLAELLVIGPRQHIERWEAKTSAIDQMAVQQAMTRLSAASDINRSNAEYYWLRGRLALLQGDTGDASGSTSAISLFTQAIEKRPTWGLAWAYLAHAYADKPAFHHRFVVALTRAAELEPYENLNQRKVIPLALAHWEHLPTSLQQRLNTIIKHGLDYNKAGIFILKAATQLDKTHVVMPLIKKKWQKNRLIEFIQKKEATL